MKIAVGIEYDGSQYQGWQRQSHTDNTLQHAIETAISFVADHTVNTICAGRTDSGVHGFGQVIHFETDSQRENHQWLLGINANLPNNISAQWIKVMDDTFHARFSALSRRYRYIIYNHPIKPGLLRSHLTCYGPHLNETLMDGGAKLLLGEQDFSSFRSADCQSHTPMRCIHHIGVHRRHRLVIIDVTANAFLHHMVRNIAGVLMAVGEGKQEVQWLQQVLDAKDRTAAGVTAPPNGLYLMEVVYPGHFNIPKQSDDVFTRFM